MGTELGSSQISTLLETLPGIANVLRSPVADALSHIIRAASRLEDFRLADAEELTRFAVRRSLMGSDEADRLVAEALQAQQKRLEKAADRVKAQKIKAKARPAKPKSAKLAKKPAKPAKHVKMAKKPAKSGKKR